MAEKAGVDAKGLFILLAIGTVIIGGFAWIGRIATGKRIGKR